MSHKSKTKSSKNNRFDRNKDIIKTIRWIRKNPAPIISTIVTILLVSLGKITDVIEFIQRWPTYSSTIILLIIGAVYFSFLFLFSYMLIAPPKSNPAISRSIAQWGLVVLTITALGGWKYSAWQNSELDKKVIVLLANFDGPEQASIRLSDIILQQLRTSTKGYEDTLVIPLKESISEQDGSPLAKTMGEKYHADLVIWGWYAVSNTDVLATIHVENLSNVQSALLPGSQMYVPQTLVTDLDHYSFQRNLSKDMSSLVLFVMGAIRYDAKDYQAASELFSQSLEITEKDSLTENFIVESSLIRVFRGNSYLFSQNYDSALDDYSQILDSPYGYAAYSNRGVIYLFFEQDYTKAVDEFTKAISLDSSSESWALYNNRATAYMILGEKEKALEDFAKGIAINSSSPYLYTNRAQIYLLKGDIELASSDIESASALDKDFFLLYEVLCTLDVQKKNYNQAITDCTKFLDAPESESLVLGKNVLIALTYNNRGMAYFLSGSYEKAIADLSQAVEINPDFSLAYMNRATAYLINKQYREAVNDYSSALEKGIEAYNIQMNTQFAIGGTLISIEGGKAEDYIYFNRGQAYLGLGDTGAAIQDFKTVQEISSSEYLKMLVSKQLERLGINQE